jgi:lipoprotein-releasing system ATP-binding protein
VNQSSRLRALKRSFKQGETVIEVLRGVDLDVQPGEIVALLGPSGRASRPCSRRSACSKAAFRARSASPARKRRSFRRAGGPRSAATAWASSTSSTTCCPISTRLENVVLPQMIHGATRADANARAEHLLTVLGLGKRLTHRPSQLSGGEQQRVAVARALANRPALVLADEPTGNLDEATADKVLAELLTLVRGEGSAALIATHNERLAARMDRVVRLHEGRLG